MAEGCEEKLDAEFVWWVLHQGRTAAKRRHYAALLAQYPGKSVVLRNQRQVKRLLKSFP